MLDAAIASDREKGRNHAEQFVNGGQKLVPDAGKAKSQEEGVEKYVVHTLFGSHE